MNTKNGAGKTGSHRRVRRAGSGGADAVPREQVLGFWRTVPADGFGKAERDAVAKCMRRTSSTLGVWRAAIRGDAPSAIALLLQAEPPSRSTVRTDLMMTALLNCALNGSAGAALVLSHALRRMPLEGVSRRRLATSWLTSNLLLAGRSAGSRVPSTSEERS